VLIEYLSPYADIIVSSRSHLTGDAGYGARFASQQEVLACPIIIPAFPAQFFESFFTEHAHLVNPSALVIDVASVKMRPLEILERLLPATCLIVGTHPMFGPASIARNGGIKGLKCVVCPVRIDQEAAIWLDEFLAAALQLNVIHKTPVQHDREMAYVQGLSHYIGRVMDGMNIPESELSTLAYDDLMDMKRIQGSDSWDLFHSIMHENPFALEVHEAFLSACKDLDEKIL
jgi:prephenate dehydrogenase